MLIFLYRVWFFIWKYKIVIIEGKYYLFFILMIMNFVFVLKDRKGWVMGFLNRFVEGIC